MIEHKTYGFMKRSTHRNEYKLGKKNPLRSKYYSAKELDNMTINGAQADCIAEVVKRLNERQLTAFKVIFGTLWPDYLKGEFRECNFRALDEGVLDSLYNLGLINLRIVDHHDRYRKYVSLPERNEATVEKSHKEWAVHGGLGSAGAYRPVTEALPKHEFYNIVGKCEDLLLC